MSGPALNLVRRQVSGDQAGHSYFTALVLVAQGSQPVYRLDNRRQVQLVIGQHLVEKRGRFNLW